MKKKIAMLMMALMMFITACGGSGGSNEVFTIEKDGETVGEISLSYAWLYTLMYKDTYEMFFGADFWDEVDEDGLTYEETFKDSMIDELKQMKVIAMEAKEAGVTLTEEEVELCKTNAAELIETIEDDTLKMTGIDEDVYAEYEADFLIYEKFKTEMSTREEIEIDKDEVRMSDFFVISFLTTDYDENGDEITFTEEQKEEQKKKAQQAYDMLKAGKTIEEVAEAFDMNPEDCMYVEGRTPEDERDEYFDEAFENAAFSLNEGEFSEVTECADGYYVIKMISFENEEETALAMEAAKEEKAEELFLPLIEEMMDKYDVTMNEENWDKISFKAEIAFKEDSYDEESYEEESHDGEDSEEHVHEE